MDFKTLCKNTLEQNQTFAEIKISQDATAIGNIEEIDPVENEIWLLQCPKRMDPKLLELQKLKMLGRTNLDDTESVGMEFTSGSQQYSFAYYDRKKSKYDLRLLDCRGTFIIRERLKASTTITTEQAEEFCPIPKKVPVPSTLRVRHPLLGSQFEEKLDLRKSVTDRLKKAALLSKSSLGNKMESKPSSFANSKKSSNKKTNQTLDSASKNDEVEFVSEEKKKKRKHKNTETSEENEQIAVTHKKSKKSNDEVSQDLLWLQNI